MGRLRRGGDPFLVSEELALLAPAQRDAARTTTLGTGELMAAALDRGAETLLVGIGEDRDRWRNLELISGIARDFNLRVIAEGIEDARQRERLLELRCECGQGEIFSMPVDATAASELLRVDLML